MSSDTDLLHQPDILQQPPLMKKKSDFILIAAVIPLCFLLLITNLQYLHFLYYWSYSPAFRDSFLGTIPHLLCLLAVDLIASSFYLARKSNPEWKTISKLLFAFNVMFLGNMLSLITSSYGGLALVGISPYIAILLFIDLISVFIKQHPHGSKAWIINYVTLIVTIFVLFLLGIFIYHFYPSDLYR